METTTPKLGLPPAPVSPEQLQSEGQIKPEGFLSSPKVTFSLSPEQMAALIIQTAEQEGWPVEKTATKLDTHLSQESGWIVEVEDIRKRQFPTGNPVTHHVVVGRIYATGGSEIWIGDDDRSLPDPLLSPLKANVLAYLAGRPLTEGERRQIVRTSPTVSKDIIVTTSPISQPYEPLGEVHADTTDLFLTTSFLKDSLFRSPLSRAVQGASPKLSYSQMDERLRSKAVEFYGNRVDAIINVAYRTDPDDGDVFASGLAVRFLPQAKEKSAEERLEELKDLLDKGLITREEYEHKRAEILGEL